MIESFNAEVSTADPMEFWFALALAIAVASYALYRALRAFSSLRLVADTPTARIRSAPQGHVELQGMARAHGELLSARLTGKPCVWYRYRIDERRSSGRNDSWVKVEEGDAERPFMLDDFSGQCLVEPRGARLRCQHRQVWFGSRRDAPPDAGSSSWGLAFGNLRRWRMTEERIHADDVLYVLGHLETPHRDSRERERLTRALLARWKADPARMRRFDRNGDGQIDLEEWEAARAEAARIAQASEQRLASTPQLAQVMAPSDRRLPFIIAAEDERSLITRLGLEAFGLTLLGVVLMVGAALALIMRLQSG